MLDASSSYLPSGFHPSDDWGISPPANQKPKETPYSGGFTNSPADDGAPVFVTLRDLLFPMHLPAIDSVHDLELPVLLNAIECTLIEKRVQLDFTANMPARTAYRGIMQLLDSPLPCPSRPLEILHVDGCDSACETCFQLAYCATAKEYLGESFSFALQNENHNPSWSALLGK